MALSELLKIVEREKIFLTYRDMSSAPEKLYGLLGLYFVDDGQPFIGLAESLKSDDALHAAVLAEELGHHFTRPTSNALRSSEVEILREERKALWWAVQYLCGLSASTIG